MTFTKYHILGSLQRIFNTRLKNCRLLFSAVISGHFSRIRMIMSVVAAKIRYLKDVRFLLGHPVESRQSFMAIVKLQWRCYHRAMKTV